MFNTDQKRAFVAVVLSGLVLFGWQYFFAPKTTNAPVATSQTTEQNVQNVIAQGNEAAQATLTQNTTAPIEPVTVESYTLTRDGYEFKISNDLIVHDMGNSSSLFDFTSLSDSKSPFQLQIVTDKGPQTVLFHLNKVEENKLLGSNANLGINLEAFIKDNGRVYFNLSSDKSYKYRIVLSSSAKKLDNGQIRHFTVLTKDIKTIEVSKDVNNDGNAYWAGIDFNFHLFAFVFNKETPIRYTTTEAGQMIIDLPTETNNFNGDFVFTKKSYDHLISLGDKLHLSVDFGFFSIIAVPTLRVLQFIYKYIPNYGIAIILCTILIRLITFPLQYKSFKSMKKMQELQPEMTRLKEKYKDDAQKMQKETMELFKKSGANPLSGCLPLLLQMPFFFAIYKVLYSSVELVGAPFYGWITDLSIKDPFYVLPVLMAVAMFAQQKMTPTTSVDPTQQKVMLFMPVIFAFIMHSLPAGLVLYILVSTVVGIFQQMLVYKMIDAKK